MRTKPIKTPKHWRRLTYHPLACLTEFGAGVDMEAFEQSVREHGYDPDEAVITHEGAILDHRHLHAICVKLNIVPTFREFCGANAGAYVCKKAHRQHLNESQRAMLAATMAKLPKGTNQHAKKEDGQICPSSESPTPTVAEAAKTMNVSPTLVKDAKVVTEKGTPEQLQSVRDGTAKVTTVAAEVKAQSQFCDRCQRLGPVKGCAACAEIKKPKKSGGKKKQGSELFSMKDFQDHLGRVVRHVDKLAKAYKVQESADHQLAHKLLGEFHTHFSAWRKKLTKENPS